jgi:hypothetical protein
MYNFIVQPFNKKKQKSFSINKIKAWPKNLNEEIKSNERGFFKK